MGTYGVHQQNVKQHNTVSVETIHVQAATNLRENWANSERKQVSTKNLYYENDSALKHNKPELKNVCYQIAP